MEQLHNGYTLDFCPGAFPLTTDSMALADFVRLPKNARVLDLGSGCGQLGHLLCAADPGCHVTGIELDENAHKTALDNILRNGLSHRVESICGNLRCKDMVQPGSFDAAVSNPPYFSGGPASRTLPAARKEDQCSLEDILSAAAHGVKYGGDVFIVHRPERLGELCALASQVRLEVKRLRLMRHRPDSPFSLILVQLRKGAKPGLILEEGCLQLSDGSPSPLFKQIYHL